MKKLIFIISLVLITCVVFGATPKFQVGDYVYLCNEDRNDDTPLCIGDWACKVMGVKQSKDGYMYLVQIYAEREPYDTTGMDDEEIAKAPKYIEPHRYWFKEKYVHCW